MVEKRSSARAKRFRQVISRSQPNCHICGTPINYTLRYDNPMSFVVDHITPLHKGGPDTIDNCAAAHRECNSKKRARLIAPIVRRSGSLS